MKNITYILFFFLPMKPNTQLHPSYFGNADPGDEPTARARARVCVYVCVVGGGGGGGVVWWERAHSASGG